MSIYSNTLKLPLVSGTTLASDKNLGLNWLKRNRELLSLIIENSRCWFGFYLIWSSSLSPLDSAFSCARFISRFYLISQTLQVYPITGPNPSESKHFDPDWTKHFGISLKFTRLDQFKSHAHPWTKTCVQGRAMIPLAEVQGKGGISHPGGLRVKEDGSPKQTNQQTNQRNQHLCRRKEE